MGKPNSPLEPSQVACIYLYLALLSHAYLSLQAKRTLGSQFSKAISSVQCACTFPRDKKQQQQQQQQQQLRDAELNELVCFFVFHSDDLSNKYVAVAFVMINMVSKPDIDFIVIDKLSSEADRVGGAKRRVFLRCRAERADFQTPLLSSVNPSK